jgi:hypothetical protein
VARQVVGDDAVVLGDLLVFEKSTPLVVVAAGRVLADQWLAGAVLEVEDPVLQTVDVDVDVVPGHGGDLAHLCMCS